MAVFLAGCDDFDLGGMGSERFREDFHFSYPISSGGSLRLESFNGSVEISSWDKNTVDIDGTKYANTEYRLKEMKVDITPSANSVSIRVMPPLDHRGNAGARFTIHVPKKTDLAGINSSNGTIRVDGIEGATRLRTSNGAVHANNLTGSLDVQTSNGSIEANGISGDTTLRSSNGSIRADIEKGRFAATTSNSSITAHLSGSETSPVRLESTNGHIELTLNTARELRASTSNSSITVRMPSSSDATVDASTSNGSITSDFDVNVHSGQISKHHMEGAIGKGGPLLELHTSNGSIKLLKL
ncbi:MAG TPA: hypothetical protein VMT15_14560 [Bryobacteraceae bacterium]|nr:hypothetical protein [Bryobacteraceae bacterium]